MTQTLTSVATTKRELFSRATLSMRVSAIPWGHVTKGMLPLVLLLTNMAAPQNTTERPCVAFSPQSTSSTNAFAKDPLQSAVTLSGDLDFYPSQHDGCWTVHVLSLPISSAKGKSMGFAISHTVTDPQSVEVGHALTFGPDRDIFAQAMHKAAADAIRNMRLARSSSRQDSR
jgi:hypothetical protein